MEQNRPRQIDNALAPVWNPNRVPPCEVVVLYKGPELMNAALEFAAMLVQDLNLPLRLIDVRVVPYGIPSEKPVRRKHMEVKLRGIVEKSAVPIRAELILVRNWNYGFRRALRSHSVVLIPIRKSCRTSQDKRMAERLRKLGHQVIWLWDE